MRELTVAEYLAEFLSQKGVSHVFGFQGGAILKLIDSICLKGGINYVQCYHEQGAAFAADAFARASSSMGVAIATSGPGATNLITGIANAHFDSIPCLFITGQDYTRNVNYSKKIRQQGFQEVDIVSIVQPITKYAAIVTEPESIALHLEKAWHAAMSGRRGSVLIDIPIDVQFAVIDADQLEHYHPKPDTSLVDNFEPALKALFSAKHPVILVGGGVRLADACDQLAEFSAETSIPMVSTLNGLDACSDIQGFAGLYGNTVANLIVNNADVLLILGSRLAVRQVGKDTTKYTSAKVIQVDIDEQELGRILNGDFKILSDLKSFLQDATACARQNAPMLKNTLLKWRTQISQWVTQYSDNVLVNHAGKQGIDPVLFCRQLYAIQPENTLYCIDVGQHQMWCAQAFSGNGSNRFITSAGHGSMGFAAPASIGAHYAKPKHKVLALTGDGGLQMNLQELHVIGQHKLPVGIIVFNNNGLGMMREVQKRYFGERYFGASPDYFTSPNLAKLADLYELDYLRIDEHDQMPLLENFLSQNRPCLVDLVLPLNTELLNRYDEGDIFDKNRLPTDA